MPMRSLIADRIRCLQSFGLVKSGSLRTKQIAEVRAMSNRKIFNELMEGVAAMKSHREGTLTLCTCKFETAPLPKVDSQLIRDTR